MAKSEVPTLKFNTPIATALFPRLQVPDTKFVPTGVYQCDLILTQEQAEPIIEKLEALIQDNLAYQKAQAGGKAKSIKLASTRPWRDDEDKDGNPTGNIVLRTKLPAVVQREGKEPITLRPKLFNADATPYTSDVIVGTGSKVRLNVEARGYCVKSEAGIKLSLKGAQVIKVVPIGPQSAADFNFSAVEDAAAGDEVGDEVGASPAESGDASEY